VKYGKNKEHDPLPQINLALLFGDQSMLPVCYRLLPGNIADVKTIENLLKELDFLDIQKLNLVMDRGFYSESNINELFKNHHKFLIGAKLSLNLVKAHLDKSRGVHLYYNDARAAEEREAFNRMLDELEYELVNKKRKPEHEKAYRNYFITHETPIRGISIESKQDSIDEAEKNFGYFALLTNGINDPLYALEVYRSKDLIEKAFGNLKERLNMRRNYVSSEEGLEGKVFVQFIALIYLSYIKKATSDHNLFKKFTMQSLLDELDVIEKYDVPGRQGRISELTGKQKEIYQYLGVEIPT
jgi:transposase